MISKQQKQQFLQMGYQDQDIIKAYQICSHRKIDIFDALNIVVNQKVALSNQNQAFPSPQSRGNLRSTETNGLFRPIKQINMSEYYQLFSKTSKMLQIGKGEIRQPNNPVGLLNVSNCCYLNSLLQCYFLMNDFVKEILEAEPLDHLEDYIPKENKTKLKRIKNQYELLEKLKKFFTKMALTSRKYLDPSDILQNLVDSMGDKIAYGEEKDLFQINLGIIQRLSQCLAHTKKYFDFDENQRKITENIRKKSNQASINESFFEAQENTKPQDDNKTRMGSIFSVQKTSPIKKLFYGTKVQYSNIPNVQNGGEKESDCKTIDFTGLILNPSHQNFYKSLDEELNYEVIIDNKSYTKKTFIRDEPEYLFFYINRTIYDKEEHIMMKSQDKFIFDFQIYIDRYLEKNMQLQSSQNQQVLQLQIQKNTFLKKMHHLNILEKKIQECYTHAMELNWLNKFPKQFQVNQERTQLENAIHLVQKELQKIESRKEKYILIYIFVHRGDTASGHYWGYGKNQQSWYRFDINCRKLEERQIITDLEKSGGTPYALLYTKSKNIPNFKYEYHTEFHQSKNLINLEGVKKPSSSQKFQDFFNDKFRQDIIHENLILKKEALKRTNKSFAQKNAIQYSNRIQACQKVMAVYTTQKSSVFFNLPIYNNFSLYLASKNQPWLSNYTVFDLSFMYTSAFKLTPKELLNTENQQLLKRIQKVFKRKFKNEKMLKQYALLGKDLEKLTILNHEYCIGRVQLIWCLRFLKESLIYLEVSQQFVTKPKQVELRLSKQFSTLMKLFDLNLHFHECKYYRSSAHTEPIYIVNMNKQLRNLMLLQLSIDGWAITETLLNRMVLDAGFKQNNSFIQQIRSLNITAGILVQNINFSNQNFASTRSQQMNILLETFYSSELGVSSQTRVSKIQKKQSIRGSQSSIEKESLSPMKQKQKQNKSKIGIFLHFEENQYHRTQVNENIEFWRGEDVDKLRVNFDVSNKIKQLLKKLEQIISKYKEIERKEKKYSRKQLQSEGLKAVGLIRPIINEIMQDESLI